MANSSSKTFSKLKEVIFGDTMSAALSMKHGHSRHRIKKKYCLQIHTTFAYAVLIILVKRNIQASKEILSSSENEGRKKWA
jgi:hypothetical protein